MTIYSKAHVRAAVERQCDEHPDAGLDVAVAAVAERLCLSECQVRECLLSIDDEVSAC